MITPHDKYRGIPLGMEWQVEEQELRNKSAA